MSYFWLMIKFANAKINLGLQIQNKREDGYHNIESLMIPIPMKDVVEVLPSEALSLQIIGKEVPGDLQDNLMMKAYFLLQKEYSLPPVQMVLKKNIAMGAGLGGGSADASAVLCLLNELFELNLDTASLKNYASKLGMDCPFFIENTPQLATERGDILSPVNFDLKGYHLRLVCPDAHVSTAQAYAGAKVANREFPLQAILNKNWDACRKELVNDFEDSVFKIHPKLQQIKQSMYDHGAVYASMSGSGSSIYGVFTEKPSFDLEENYFDFAL